VQKETESELLAVKRQIKVVSTGFETRLEQSNADTQGIIYKLASQMVDHRSEVDATITKLGQNMSSRFIRFIRFIEQINQAVTQEKSATESRFEQVNAKIVALESKISEVPSRIAVAAESRTTGNSFVSPSVVHQSDYATDHDSTMSNSRPINENPSCSCQSSSCNVGVSQSVHAARVNVSTEPLSLSSFLSSSKLPLPFSDDSSDTNPVFHLRRLHEFI
jgi:hypothetical protein